MRSSILVWPVLIFGLCSAADLRTGHYAGREVVFENVEGVAVFQGDIILGATEDVERAPDIRAKAGNESTAVSSTSRLWTNGIVPYAIDAALSERQRQTILQAIDHWNARTPIRLKERAAESNYVRFASGTSTISCSSSVGMIGGAQMVRLPEACSLGATIHEIGHAIGLWHEQSRNDRNQFLTVLYENIDKPNGIQFDQTLDDGRDIGPYDFGSIMHYGPFDFSRDGFAPALESVPAGIPLGQRSGLSAGDVDAVRRLYGASGTKTTISSTPSGLKLRVDGVLVDDGAAFEWAPGSRHAIEAPYQGSEQTRYVFGNWSDGGDLRHDIVVSADRTVYIANFVRQHRVQVTFNEQGAGTVALDPTSSDGFYAERSSVFISAQPAAGYNFLEWSVRPSRSLNPKSITIYGPTNILTSFTRSAVATIASVPVGRIVRVDGGQYSTPVNFAWPQGERHAVAVDPPEEDFQRFRFTGWSDGGPETRTIVSAGRAATYTANFVTQYSLTTQTVGGRANSISLSPAGDNGYYDEGTTVLMTAIPAGGLLLSGWSGDARGTDNPAAIVMNEQKLVKAAFGSRLPPISMFGAASGVEAAISPGEIVSIYGRNIGPPNPVGAQVSSGRLTTQLGGAEVYFDGQPAPLTYASQHQINAVVPYAVRSRSFTSVQVRGGAQVTAPVSLAVADAAPGLFTADSSGRGPGAILNENGTANSASNPARRGSIVVLFATGEGVTNPAVADGQLATSVYPKPALPVSVRIGGQSAVVHYAGAAPGFVSGLLQINAQVPAAIAFGPNVPVSIVIGSRSSPPGVTVAVQ